MRHLFTKTILRKIPFKLERKFPLKIKVNQILVHENIKMRHPFIKTVWRTIPFKLERKFQFKIKVN